MMVQIEVLDAPNHWILPNFHGSHTPKRNPNTIRVPINSVENSDDLIVIPYISIHPIIYNYIQSFIYSCIQVNYY